MHRCPGRCLIDMLRLVFVIENIYLDRSNKAFPLALFFYSRSFNPMVVRVLIGLLVLCSACQTGKIPCPRIKSAKLHKTYRPPSSSLLTARADKPKPEEEAGSRYTKPDSERYIKNVTMEEWDCPRPGAKKYMPKSVKDNIRKNKKRFEEDLRQTRADSLSSR